MVCGQLARNPQRQLMTHIRVTNLILSEGLNKLIFHQHLVDKFHFELNRIMGFNFTVSALLRIHRSYLQIGAVYAQKRAYGKIESHDSVKLKVEFIYKVLVEDKLIQPLAKDQISDPNMRHKLALWISRQLPADHPLLKES